MINMKTETIITGYELEVRRGPRAGLVKQYLPHQRVLASRFADKLDNEYGAICASVQPIFIEVPA